MKATRRITLTLASVGLALIVPLAHAAGESQSALKEEAKVSEAAAKTAALAKVPHGIVRSTELEKENGRLVWSFDIARPTSKDLTEVHIDAKTGQIVSMKKETPALEASEVKAERKATK